MMLSLAFDLRPLPAVSLQQARVFSLRIVLLVTTNLVACLSFVTQNVHPAVALQSKPPTSSSWYVTTTDTNQAETLGCNQAKSDASFNPPVKSMVVLDFGGQTSSGSGTIEAGQTVVTFGNAQIEAVAEWFSYGYLSCIGTGSTSILTLGIGTNNSAYDVSSSGGATWAQVVTAIQNGNASNGYNTHVTVVGANDIEPGFGSASATEAWAQGFSSTTSSMYIDYGSADGCPTTTSSNGPCSNGWSQSDVWNVSWGSGAAIPLPEIYNSLQAQEWAMISLYSAQHQSGPMVIYGPMDEYDLDNSTNTPDQAWSQLWTALNNTPSTSQNMIYSTEIQK
jgi:hypothetical protein